MVKLARKKEDRKSKKSVQNAQFENVTEHYLQ